MGKINEEEQPQTGSPLSIESEIWSSLSRKMLEASIDAGSDYARLMIQISFGAIPVYVALRGLLVHAAAGPEDIAHRFLVIFPAALFIVSAIAFIFAFHPRRAVISLNSPTLAKEAYLKIVTFRRRANASATVLFIIAASFAVWQILFRNW